MVRLILELDRKLGERDRLEKNRDVRETPPLKINIPRRSRGFFLDGRSPLVLAARVTSRWYDLPIAKVCYLPPVNGLKNFPSSVVLLPDPLPADA